jgi:hypothetical protein
MEELFALDGLMELIVLVLAIALAGGIVESSYNGKIHPTRYAPISAQGFWGMLKTRYGNTVLSLVLSMTGVSVYLSVSGIAQTEPELPRFVAYLPFTLTMLLVGIYWYGSFAPLVRLYMALRSASPLPKPLGLLIGKRLAPGSTFTRDPLDHTASIIQRIKFDYVLLNEHQYRRLGSRAPTPSFAVYDSADPAAASALQTLPLLVRSFPVELSQAPATRDIDAVLGIHETSIGLNHAMLTAISGFGNYPEDLTTSGNATIGQLVRTVFTVESPSQKLMVALNIYEVLLKQSVFLGLARRGTITIPAIAERFSDSIRGMLLDSPRTWLHVLHHLSTDDALFQERLAQRVEPVRWSEAILPIVEYLKLEHSVDNTVGSLFDLLKLFAVFRNKTRGHGIIRDQTALLVLPMFMNALMLALQMCGVEQLTTVTDPAAGLVTISNPDGLWPAGDLIVYHSSIDDLAYLSEIRKNKAKMIAYIAGEYVVPSRRTVKEY